MHLRRPYVLFLADARDQLAAKTAEGVFTWRPQWCIGQMRFDECRANLDLGVLTLAQAAEQGAGTLIVGVANAGGVIPEAWVDLLVDAVAAGLDVASGLHDRLTHIPRLKAAAATHGRSLVDVRHPERVFAVGTGERRPGRRLLAVGTDCSVGKMYATLAIEREMKSRGLAADFRATGQTGIFIAGEGVSVDAVVADFISGAVEWLSPANDADHWDLIEGQGSLFHPSYAGVSLGLLHGAQPDAIVLCHEPTRTHMRGLPGRPLPDLKACLEANLEAARLTNPDVRCVGLAINTRWLPDGEREAYLAALADTFDLPCVDPLKTGVGPIVDRLVP